MAVAALHILPSGVASRMVGAVMTVPVLDFITEPDRAPLDPVPVTASPSPWLFRITIACAVFWAWWA